MGSESVGEKRPDDRVGSTRGTPKSGAFWGPRLVVARFAHHARQEGDRKGRPYTTLGRFSRRSDPLRLAEAIDQDGRLLILKVAEERRILPGEVRRQYRP